MPVLSIAGAENLGDGQDLVRNPDEHHVVVVRIRLLPEGVVKTLSGIDARVGHDAITIKDSRSVGKVIGLERRAKLR